MTDNVDRRDRRDVRCSRCMRFYYALQIYDYEQFYLDLRVANTNKTAEWIKEYDLTSYYKLKSVTTEELHNLAESLTRSNDSPLFEQWVENVLITNKFIARPVTTERQ